MKTYLPVVLLVGGVHLALIFILTLSGDLSARTESPTGGLQLPAAALQDRCGLHRIVHATGPVQVLYGAPAKVRRDYVEAKAKFFPNAWYFVEAGFAAEPASPRQATVRYCPTCRATELRWRAQYLPRSTP